MKMAALALNNMESHIAESVLEYLLNIIQDDEIGNMSKLAALAVLNKLFKTDTDHGLKYRCVQADLVCSLLIALDAGLSQTCHPADTVYVQVAMEIMWQLSKMQIGQLQTLITESVIRSLLAYLDVDGEFYRYGMSLNLCPLGNFSCFFCRLLIIFKINFFDKFFQEYHQNVGSDLDQNNFTVVIPLRQFGSRHLFRC